MYLKPVPAARLLAVIPAATVPGHALAALSAPGASVTLKYNFSSGEVLHYKITETMQGSTMEMPMSSRTTMLMTETVKSVDPRTGNATIALQYGKPSTTMTTSGKPVPGTDMPETPAQTMTIVMSPLGKQVSTSMGGSADAPSGGFGQSIAFPNHPVKVGDVWRDSSVLLSASSGQSYMKQSLLGLGISGADSVARIAMHYSTSIAPSTMSAALTQTTGSGSEQFDVSAGKMLGYSSSSVITTKAALPKGMPSYPGDSLSRAAAYNTRMTITMSMQLVDH